MCYIEGRLLHDSGFLQDLDLENWGGYGRRLFKLTCPGVWIIILLWKPMIIHFSLWSRPTNIYLKCPSEMSWFWQTSKGCLLEKQAHSIIRPLPYLTVVMWTNSSLASFQNLLDCLLHFKKWLIKIILCHILFTSQGNRTQWITN